jgi:hypothetical protein
MKHVRHNGKRLFVVNPNPNLKAPIDEIPVQDLQQLMDIEGVLGIDTDVENGVRIVMVLVDKPTKALKKQIEAKLGRYPVRLVPTGGIQAL